MYMKKTIASLLKMLAIYDYSSFLYHGLLKPSKWKDTIRFLLNRCTKAETDILPLPPMYLRWLVINQTDPKIFLESGKIQFHDLMIPLLKRNGFLPESFNTILDFGCGCGRIIRYWHNITDAEIWGTDYNPKLISWCKKNITFAQFCINNLEPPMNFSDNTFDFIYARSILTHLNEELQEQWLFEIRRILKPRGIFLFTVMGDCYKKLLTTEELQVYEDGKIVIRESSMVGKNQCAVFHPQKYVYNKLPTMGFNILDQIVGGTVNTAWQDTYLANVMKS